MKLSREEIILGLPRLPAFPGVVNDILHTLSDAHAGMTVLVSHLQHDPIISARILSAANRQIRHSGREPVGDVYTAASYIGLNQIHTIAVGATLLDFAKKSPLLPSFLGAQPGCWHLCAGTGPGIWHQP